MPRSTAEHQAEGLDFAEFAENQASNYYNRNFVVDVRAVGVPDSAPCYRSSVDKARDSSFARIDLVLDSVLARIGLIRS